MGAVRNVNVIAMRLDGPGMRWGRERSELVLQLRCILVGGQWNDFVDYLARGTPRCGLNRSRPRSMRQRLEKQDLHPNGVWAHPSERRDFALRASEASVSVARASGASDPRRRSERERAPPSPKRSERPVSGASEASGP